MNDDEALSRLNMPDPGIALLAEVITCPDVDSQIRDAAFDHPSISDDEILTFASNASEGLVLRCLAATDRIEILRHYMLEGDREQRATVTFNSASDKGIIMLALSDPDQRVRCNAMYSPRLTEEQVAWHRDNDPSEFVRQTAAVALEDEVGRFLRSSRSGTLDNDEGTLSPESEWRADD